ncbi:unnamed protein product [Periconia digitata]|uniref:Uncharacterized protein n=1 Tax=Periconia digitata TaxID=1303443 RepID=A0A9W4U8D4_9PLEO|nr:unnamed protein product [Periconia digitata]
MRAPELLPATCGASNWSPVSRRAAPHAPCLTWPPFIHLFIPSQAHHCREQMHKELLEQVAKMGSMVRREIWFDEHVRMRCREQRCAPGRRIKVGSKDEWTDGWMGPFHDHAMVHYHATNFKFGHASIIHLAGICLMLRHDSCPGSPFLHVPNTMQSHSQPFSQCTRLPFHCRLGKYSLSKYQC